MFPHVQHIQPLTHKDLDELVILHRVAFSGTLGVSLGKQYTKDFLNWFASNPQAIGLIYRQSEVMVGYVFGAPQGYSIELNRELFRVMLWSILTHPQVILDSRFIKRIPNRLAYMLRKVLGGTSSAIIPIQQDSTRFRLVGIGVSPSFRQQGIGQNLIKAFEKQVWHLGYEEIQLTVYAHNVGARKLYESCGWTSLNADQQVLTYQIART